MRSPRQVDTTQRFTLRKSEQAEMVNYGQNETLERRAALHLFIFGCLPLSRSLTPL